MLHLNTILIVLAALASYARPLIAQDALSDPFFQHVLGEWSGEGEYDGNSLDLTRVWTLELMDQFARADMQVHMSNGFSFGALTYWKVVSPDQYEVAWMDGTGRLQLLQAKREASTGRVATSFLDSFAENGPEIRIWEFTPTSPDSYEETLYRMAGDRLEVVAVFRFARRR